MEQNENGQSLKIHTFFDALPFMKSVTLETETALKDAENEFHSIKY